jgi:DNA-binding SARP family transcriptional activator
MVQIDPLAEEAQQSLMRLYLRQDEVGLALRQYRQFENQLQQELGIRPTPETKALYDDILRQHTNLVKHNALFLRNVLRQTILLPLWDETILF